MSSTPPRPDGPAGIRVGPWLLLLGVVLIAVGFVYLQWGIYYGLKGNCLRGFPSCIYGLMGNAYALIAAGALVGAPGWFLSYWPTSGTSAAFPPPERAGFSRGGAVLGLVGFVLIFLGAAINAGDSFAVAGGTNPNLPDWTAAGLTTVVMVGLVMIALAWFAERRNVAARRGLPPPPPNFPPTPWGPSP